MDWTEIGKWGLAALGVIAGAGIAIKFAVNRKSNNSQTVVKGNKAGGDIIVGNKTTDSNNKR